MSLHPEFRRHRTINETGDLFHWVSSIISVIFTQNKFIIFFVVTYVGIFLTIFRNLIVIFLAFNRSLLKIFNGIEIVVSNQFETRLHIFRQDLLFSDIVSMANLAEFDRLTTVKAIMASFLRMINNLLINLNRLSLEVAWHHSRWDRRFLDRLSIFGGLRRVFERTHLADA